MNSKQKWILLFVGLVVLIILAAVTYNALLETRISPETPKSSIQTPPTAQNTEQTSPTTGKLDNPIDFSITDSNGNEVSVSDFYGKPIVINFWASWCPPCKAELPDFEKVYAEVQGEVVFMMVDLVDGSRETLEKGAIFWHNNSYTMPVFFDLTGEASNLLKISAIPTTIFLDRDGLLISKNTGMITEEVLRQGIESIK